MQFVTANGAKFAAVGLRRHSPRPPRLPPHPGDISTRRIPVRLHPGHTSPTITKDGLPGKRRIVDLGADLERL
jgi:hypothetical protein